MRDIPILIPVNQASPPRACLLLDLPIVIGRGGEASIRVDAMSADEKHCLIYLDEGSLAAKDLSTASGTFVNGRRIQNRILRVGDRLTIADTTFLISGLGGQDSPDRSEIPNRPPLPAAAQPCLGLTCATA